MKVDHTQCRLWPRFPRLEYVKLLHSPIPALITLVIKTTDGVKKVWMCLFTCMVVRAIHLEVMTSEEFILGVKRFISQRGTPSILISDNASQFKRTRKVLTSVWHNTTSCADVQWYASEHGSGLLI